MTEPAFDQDRADVLVNMLGNRIVEDDAYSTREWDQLALVFQMDGRRMCFGYVYQDDDWAARTPQDFEVLQVAAALRVAMTIPGEEPWKKALVQIDRASGRIEIDFDYAGDRWVPDKSDPKSFALSLRP